MPSSSDTVLASALRLSVLRLARRMRAERADTSLTLSQLAALATLERQGPLTPRELAAAERVQPPSMTRLLASLEGAGLVLRTGHPTDGRQVLLTTSEAGVALLREDRRRRDAWLAQRLRELDRGGPRGPGAGDRGARPAGLLVSTSSSAPVRATGTFRSLRVRNYRLFAAGQVVSLSGTWGQRVAQDWLVLELSGNSGVALGITTALQFTPVLLFGLYGGVLADRYDKRRLLLAAQAAMGVLALVLAALDLSGAVQLWHVYALAFGLGVASVIDTPVRQAFVSEMVGPDELPNAVSLNSATFNSARIVGPAAAGIAIAAVGTGWVFLVNALSYVAVLAGLQAMRTAELYPTQRVERAKGQLREGLAYVRSRPDLLVPMVLVFMVGTFGLNFQITLALAVKEVFGRGAGAYGLLSAFLAVGSLLGALASARRSGPPGSGRCSPRCWRSGSSRSASGWRRPTRSWPCCSSRPAWRC